MGSIDRKKSRDLTRESGSVRLGTVATRDHSEGERALLVGLDRRTRARGAAKGTVTAQAGVARDVAQLTGSSPSALPSAVAPKPEGRPSIPEFDAEESLAELRRGGA